MRTLVHCRVVLALGATTCALGAEPMPSASPEPAVEGAFSARVPDAVTQHSVAVDGRKIPYT
ncbi:MAG: hypothetical protein M3160_06775, partial [Candidatus Eremiobacteraeota bacterium]|nr:hypothetical protein [Candidatus Eremiobacteraeota bacterium]